MKEPKDIFSTQAAAYASSRPVYPRSLYDFILNHVPAFDAAWDVGTGNGQVAKVLSEYFTNVYATDISDTQLQYAVKKPNINYSKQRGEQTNFADNTFNLITIGTALHWFDFDSFYKEVNRVAKPNAVIAAWAYSPMRSIPAIDEIIDNFFHNVVYKYWDAERKYVDEEYTTIPFPFKTITAPPFEINAKWTNDQLIGYLNSWSAVQHYIKQNGNNPVSFIEDQIRKNWKDGEKLDIHFPLFLKIGLVNKDIKQ